MPAKIIKPARLAESGLHSASKLTSIVASIVVFVMMLVTVFDVVGRYLFNRPIKGAWELVGLLLVFAGTWGWSNCQMKNRHISVTVVIERLPQIPQVIIRSLAYLFGFVIFSLICWQMLLRAILYISLGDQGLTETIELPFSPFMLGLAISSGLLALTLFIDFLHLLVEVTRK